MVYDRINGIMLGLFKENEGLGFSIPSQTLNPTTSSTNHLLPLPFPLLSPPLQITPRPLKLLFPSREFHNCIFILKHPPHLQNPQFPLPQPPLTMSLHFLPPRNLRMLIQPRHYLINILYLLSF